MTGWLTVRSGVAPLLVAIPHSGTDIPAEIAPQFISEWDARRDADWWIDHLYDFAGKLGATIVRTAISRSAIDVNRDPSGASLYPGMTTTGLCPLENFEGEPIYLGSEPDEVEIARRRAIWFDPYHAALQTEIDRLRLRHDRIVVYDAHSIRSRIPRLFEGELPLFNIGSNKGQSCAPELAHAVADACADFGSVVINGRFVGGWTTRNYGKPEEGVHAVQMELSMRGYLREPSRPGRNNWPAPYDPNFAAPMANVLAEVLGRCVAFAEGASA